MWRSIGVMTVATLQISCATISQINFLSTADEIQIGRQAARDVERSLPMYKDPEVVAYVQELGRVLAEQAKRKDVAYRFKVVDTEDVNAFALPGGWLYVNAGLVAAADTESELAGVMAHEIGHVSAGTARVRFQHDTDCRFCWRSLRAGRTAIRSLVRSPVNSPGWAPG
jgi:predicted Zn-dependent protease